MLDFIKLELLSNINSFFEMKFKFNGIEKIKRNQDLSKENLKEARCWNEIKIVISMKVDLPRFDHIYQIFNFDHLTEEEKIRILPSIRI